MRRFLHLVQRAQRTLLGCFIVTVFLGLPLAVVAGPLGRGDSALVVILDDGGQWADERIDTINTFDMSTRNNALFVPGSRRLIVSLLPEGADARVLVPTDDSVDATWTDPNFDDATWTAAKTGIGYGTSPAGDAGLEAYWSMETIAGGTVVADDSGNGRDGTYENLDVANNDLPESGDVPPALDGKSFTSLNLDGRNNNDATDPGDRVVITGYKGVTGGQPRTVAAWIKTDRNGDGIIAWGNNALAERWTVRLVNNRLRLDVQNGNVNGVTPLVDDEWHHVAVVFGPDDGDPGAFLDIESPALTDVRLYVDGKLDGSFGGDPYFSAYAPRSGIDTGATQMGDVHIGDDFFDNNRRMRGLLDDVAIWSQPLTADQIARLAAGEVQPDQITNENTIGNLIETNIEAQMKGRNPGVYIRIRFDVEDPTTFDRFVLRMRYVDSYVAYLNGEEVTPPRDGAPLDRAWNSAALTERPSDDLALRRESIQLERTRIQAGTNVLAIHGVNVSEDEANFLILPEIYGRTPNIRTRAITDSNTPGVAYALSSFLGRLYEIDLFDGSARQIAELGRLLPDGEPHNRFMSITNLPGSDLLYILRTDNAFEPELIDTYDPTPGAADPYNPGVLATLLTNDAVSITDGPPFGDFGNHRALYTIGASGALEAHDPASPGSEAVPIREDRLTNPLPGDLPGDMVSITNLEGDSEHLYVLQDGPADSTDQIYVYDLLGDVDDPPLAVHGKDDSPGNAGQEATAQGITDSTVGGFLFSHTRNDRYAQTEVALGQAGVDDLFRENLGGAWDVTGLGAVTSDANQFVYLADDFQHNRVDLHDANYPFLAGFLDDVMDLPETPPAPDGRPINQDWADQSFTDQDGALWSLHVDGKLYRIDPASGQTDLVVDLDPPELTANLSTYESITNLPGDPRLFILRNDRLLYQKHANAASNDTVDTYDTGTGDYAPDQYSTVGNRSISISDGPPFSGVEIDTEGQPAVYIIGRFGSFEVLNPADPGARGISQIRPSTGAQGDRDYISITNLPGDDEHMYLLRDVQGSGVPDVLDVFDLDGTAQLAALELNGTGAKSITDMGNGRLYTVASGAAANIIDVDIAEPENSVVQRFATGGVGNTAPRGAPAENGRYVSITNIEGDVTPPRPCDSIALSCGVVAGDPLMARIEITGAPAECSCSRVDVFLDGVQQNTGGPLPVPAGGILVLPLPNCQPGQRELRVTCISGGNPGASATCSITCPGGGGGQSFVRGNVDAQGSINISDPIFLLSWLFQGGTEPPCLESGNVDGQGTINISDPIFLLSWLFQGGPAPPAPFPDCGRPVPDPGPGAVDCKVFSLCP